MADSSTSARAEAVEAFAAVLSGLRESAGTPSFRVMAGRSRVISHTTLHEAVKGYRLPSWGTTAQTAEISAKLAEAAQSSAEQASAKR